MKRYLLIVLCCVFFLLLSACGSSDAPPADEDQSSVADSETAVPPTSPPTATQPPAEPTTASAETTAATAVPPTEVPTLTPQPTATTAVAQLTIGVLSDLSGNLAPYGQATWQGLQLGFEYATDGSMQAGGRSLDLRQQDTASDIATATSAANELLAANNLAFLVAPTNSAASMAVQQIAAGANIVAFATAAAPDITGTAWNQNTFRLCPIFPPDGPIITASGAGPITTQFLNNASVAARPAGDIGITGLSWYHYTLPQTEANDWLVEQHQAQYGTPPDLYVECGFATAQAIVAALEATGGETNSGQLIAALEGLQFDGPKGTYTIRAADHQVLAPLYVVRLANVDDPDQAYFELIEEIPGDDAQLPCTAPGCS